MSRKLGVRRRVRLIVTFGRIGPAVIGIFRPTVLLPSVIVEGKSPNDLEPILAHELMHFRRGDLWVGMLQVLAQALWWFHPLVWIVNRLVTRDAERCCDEAVIARLGCDPLRYARSLVDVLELKQSLKPVPVVPGVRPVEVTSKRLERIMTLGQGSLKRSPWWCWAVMLAATIMLLPGAAFVAGAKEKNKNRRSRNRKTSDRSAREQTDKHAQDKLVTRNYPVGDVFEALQSRFSLNEDQIRELLGKETMQVAGGTWSKPSGTDVDFDEQGNVTITDTTVIPGRATPQLWYKGKTLVVRHTREAHRRISRHLEIERKYGYDEIEIETRIVTVDRKYLDALGINWMILDVDLPKREVHPSQPSNAWQPLDRPFPEEGAKPQSLARTIVDKNTPVTQATIGNSQVNDVISAIESRDASANVLMMPKITCSNGRSVTVQDCSQRPFVVSLRRIDGDGEHAYKPRIRVVNEGITMRLRPVLLPDDKVWLDLELTMSEILGVETAQIQTGEKDPPSVQVPEVATRLINSTLSLPPGKSLIIGGLTKKGANDKQQSLLVVLRASKRVPDEAGSTFAPAFAFESNGVKPRIIVQAEEEENTIHRKFSRFDKFTQLVRDLKNAAFGSDELQDPYFEEHPESDGRSSEKVSNHELLKVPHYSGDSNKTLMQRLDKLEWTFGLPAGAAVQEAEKGYRVTASPWRTTFKGEDGKLLTVFSADKGNLVVGKGDDSEVKLELVGHMNWQVDDVRAFAQRGVWSNTAKQRYVLTGNVRFVDNAKRIQLTADKASFDSNRILLEGNAQVQRLTNGKTDHLVADRIEWHVDKNAFNAVGTVLFRTTDKKNKTVSAPSEAQAASTSSPADKGESRTGRLMFGVGVNSDAGVTSSTIIDENVQPASAEKTIEWVPAPTLQQLVEQFNELMDKQRYTEAKTLALQAKKLEPDSPVAQNMLWKVEFARRILKSSKTLPSPYYLDDDVQYFPAGPEFKLRKDQAPRLERYVKATVSRPLVKKCGQDLVPTDDEVLQAVEKQRQIGEGGLALLAEKHIDNVRIVKEKIADYVDPPKSTRFVGSVQAHHTHYKCSVYFTETKKVTWPVPHKSSEDTVEVVYLDVVHNHRLEDSPHTNESVKPGRDGSPEEARIKKMLNNRIDVKYDNVPLNEVVKDIAQRAGVNVYLDRRGLESEGIAGDEPVTLNIKQPIRVSSALKLLLADHHLTFVIEDEVVKIISEQTGREVYTKVYNVADLVVPVPEFVYLSNALRHIQPQESKLDFSSLIDTIVTTIEPQSWDKAGGPGAINSFEQNLSLVVSQSKEVHKQIADLLDQMRQLYEVQVTCELKTVTMDQASYDAFWDEPLKESAAILSPTETFFLLQAFNGNEKINVSNGPKVTVFPGQHLIAAVDYHPDRQSSFREQLHLAPVVSADRRSVNLECATAKNIEQFEEKKKKIALADGQTLLLDVTSQLNPSDAKTLNKRVFVLVTPHVVVEEEETGE